MIPQPPKDRMLKPDHSEKPLSSTSSPVRPPLVVVRETTRQQAQRACATVADVLGRKPAK